MWILVLCRHIMHLTIGQPFMGTLTFQLGTCKKMPEMPEMPEITKGMPVITRGA